MINLTLPVQRRYVLPIKTIVLLCMALAVAGITKFGFSNNTTPSSPDPLQSKNGVFANPDSVESAAAFMEVYKVLMHPRCMNCHPAGDVPLQNEDSHIHTMLPKRGKDGHGLYAMKCTNCHQPANSAGLRTPPGNPKWALPPADMKMVFENKTPHELALQIMDYNRNGHKNKEQLLEHARDTLVKWGWHPGEGRPLPPLDYETFVKQWDTWINKGAYAPAQ